MLGDDPPYLTVGTEVSAKYKGAFCEAKVRKVVRCVKCKVTYKLGLGSSLVTDDQIRGTLRVGSNVEVRHPEKNQYVEATISKIQDYSQYTVVFDDGDITTLRRTALCLKSGRHFAESETLDQLPLTHPEHFSNPVVGGRRGRRSRQAHDESSEDEESPKKGKKKEEKEVDIGKVVCVELGDKKKQKDNWFPGLVVAPTAQDTVRIRVKDEYLVRSFKDGRYYTVPKKEATEFTREIGAKVDNNTLKTAVEKALLYLDRDELPPHWDRELLFGLDENSTDSDTDGTDSDSSDDEPREEKDHFVAQLYKFMDDRGTPINKGPTIGSRDVDLYKLFKVVHKMGGYNRVTNHNQWKTVSHKLGFGQHNVPSTNSVKQAYKKFLHSFEDFYRKLGCTMVNHPRGSRSRVRSGRSLIRDRDRATPTTSQRREEDGKDGSQEMAKEVNSDKEASTSKFIKDCSEPSVSAKDSVKEAKSNVKEGKTEKQEVKGRLKEVKESPKSINKRPRGGSTTRESSAEGKDVAKEVRSTSKEDTKTGTTDSKKEVKGSTIESRSIAKEAKSTAVEGKVNVREAKTNALEPKNSAREAKTNTPEPRSYLREAKSYAAEARGNSTDPRSGATEVKTNVVEARSSRETKSSLVEGKASAKEAKNASKDAKSNASETKIGAKESKNAPKETKATAEARSAAKEAKNGAEVKSNVKEPKSVTRESKSNVTELRGSPKETKSSAKETKTNVAETKKSTREVKIGVKESRSNVKDVAKESKISPEMRNSPREAKSNVVETKNIAKEVVKASPVEAVDAATPENRTSVRDTKVSAKVSKANVSVGKDKESGETSKEKSKEMPSTPKDMLRSSTREVKENTPESSKEVAEDKKERPLLPVAKKKLERRFQSLDKEESKSEDEKPRIARETRSEKKEDKQEGKDDVKKSDKENAEEEEKSQQTRSKTKEDLKAKKESKETTPDKQTPKEIKTVASSANTSVADSPNSSLNSLGTPGSASRDADKKIAPRPKKPEEDETSPGLRKRGRRRRLTDEKPGVHIGTGVIVGVGDRLKVYYGPTHESKVTYEAKVVEVDEDADPVTYLVHYLGWNTRYDEWIKRQRIAENLSWTPARAKRWQQQSSTGRPVSTRKSRASTSGSPGDTPARSTTPSSITSTSSRTKSSTPRLSRSDSLLSMGQETRRRTRRTSGFTDISVASEESESDGFESDNESGLPRTRSSRERKLSLTEKDDAEEKKNEELPEKVMTRRGRRRMLTDEKEGDTKNKSILEEEKVEIKENKIENEHLMYLEASDDIPVVEERKSKRIRKLTRQDTDVKDDVKEEHDSEVETDKKPVGVDPLQLEDQQIQPKGRDFDLNQIRSELKGIERAVKIPISLDVKSEEDASSASNKSNIVEEIVSKCVSAVVRETGLPEEVPCVVKEKQVPDKPDTSKEDDIYEFKEPEPFEFEVRTKREGLLMSDDKLKKSVGRRIGARLTPELHSSTLTSSDGESEKTTPKKKVVVKKETSKSTTLGDLKKVRICRRSLPVSRKLDKLAPVQPLTLEAADVSSGDFTKRVCPESVPVVPVETKLVSEDRFDQLRLSSSPRPFVMEKILPQVQSVQQVTVPKQPATVINLNVSKMEGAPCALVKRAEPVDSVPSSSELKPVISEETKVPVTVVPPLSTPVPIIPEVKVLTFSSTNVDSHSLTKSIASNLPLSTSAKLSKPLMSDSVGTTRQFQKSHNFVPIIVSASPFSFSAIAGIPKTADVGRIMCPPAKETVAGNVVDSGVPPSVTVAPARILPVPVAEKSETVESKAKEQESSFVEKIEEPMYEDKDFYEKDDTVGEAIKRVIAQSIEEEERDENTKHEGMALVLSNLNLGFQDQEKRRETRKKSSKKTLSREFVDSETDSDSSEGRLVIDKMDEESGREDTDNDIDTLRKEITLKSCAPIEKKDNLETGKGEDISFQSSWRHADLKQTEKTLRKRRLPPDLAQSDDEQCKSSKSDRKLKKTDNFEEDGGFGKSKLSKSCKDGSSDEGGFGKETSERESGAPVDEDEEEAENSLKSLLCEETIPGSPVTTTGDLEETPKESQLLFASVPGTNCSSSTSAGQSSSADTVPAVIGSSVSASKTLLSAAPPPTTSSYAGISVGQHRKRDSNDAAPVMDNTPPTTPESSISTISGSPRGDQGGSSPPQDNDSSKSPRDSSEIDLDSLDSLLNVEGSSSNEARNQMVKMAMKKQQSDLEQDDSPLKKRRRVWRRSERMEECGVKKTKSRHSSGRHRRNTVESESDDLCDNSSSAVCASLTNSDSVLPARSPRPSKYNFYVELDPDLDASQRIELLQQKLQELRKTYLTVKSELASIDRRRKKLRKREREVEKASKQEVTCS